MRRLLGICLLLVSGGWAADARRPITETDLYAFQWVADPQISPDGRFVAYTHVRVSAKHDNYDTALWLIPTDGGPARALTTGTRDTGPRWSPDGRTIAFLRVTEKDGKPQPAQIYVLPMDGGEARALTEIPKGAGGMAWSPDGRKLAFLSTAIDKDFEKQASGEEPSDVKVITRAAYRFNGLGYYEIGRPAHVWVVETSGANKKPQQVTRGEFEESGLSWARDGQRLFFTSNRVQEPYYQPPLAEVYSVGMQGGEPAKEASIAGSISEYAVSPDGTRVALIGALNAGSGVTHRSYSQPDLFVAQLGAGSAPRNLTESYDYDIGGRIGGDQAPPRGSSASRPYWSRDGRYVYCTVAEEGRSNLKRIDTETGKVEALTSGDHDLFSYSASGDGAKVAVLISTPVSIGDLFLVDGRTGKLTQLTRVNEELFSKLHVTPPVTLWYKSFDGKRIQAWAQLPPDYQEGNKYPLILNIHGGPHSAYGYTFDHEFQWMAAKGYIVLYPNPRGSTTYGQEFGNLIQYKYPGDDHKDLMAGVDEVIAKGWADRDRLAVTGGSGGGVLTNWAIGHTDRFKAAVSQRSIADWRDFWYAADFTLFTPSWFRGAPWEHEADFRERSPITYVEKIHTPLMLIEGDADYRTPPAAGGEQMFRALKYLKRPVVMVRFPGESHELSRSGKPTHRVERLQHIVGWFDEWVMGQKNGAYVLR